jgi:hypothetical protein
LVSGECDIGTSEVDDFDWNDVGINVLTFLLQQADIETAAWFYISFVVPLTICQ